MMLGGLQKNSFMDYPDKISCIIFTAGCNFRCPFCHNGYLVVNVNETPLVKEKYIFDFLESRKGLIDAVVITGGEPLMQKDIGNFMKKIKSMGFLVKLDTNGSFPDILKELIDGNLLDYIAMDIKATPEKYEEACGAKVDVEKIKRSVEMIKESGIDYEFRTTAIKEIHTQEDFEKIGKWLNGAKKYYLQKFSSKETIEPEFSNKTAYTTDEMEKICKSIRNYSVNCVVRGN
ncbi:MAG: anaerobic ribonucleoside-triphosphate reductase activating protein [Candidatus Aenigmarchaeota archaeon]|nr:anaerobic ribonucleoside-triphosphate reductase activating protein [Candidatus Aenigmarchaeota archaeon]